MRSTRRLGSQNETATDSSKPVLICPQNTGTDLDANRRIAQVTWILPTASDNSGTVLVSGSHEPGSEFTIGVTRVSYEAEDPTGNTASCEFNVTVRDVLQPVLICPPNIETDLDSDKHSVQVSWILPNASDNSGTVLVSGSHEPGTEFTVGITTVSYEAEDPTGNTANCEFNVTVRDSVQPILNCPQNIITDLNADKHTAQVSWILPNASDNSGIVYVSGSHEPGTEFTIGVTTVSYQAEDPTGNTANCEFNVTVRD
ncbi:hyalin-like [Ptychodera flava]|uniref:hyalin-like n=1 Tax=Ptychodera flava TaxID=63121 RepID=UPI00396A3997